MDQRVNVLWHSQNRGVGGAVISGIEAALKDEAGIIAKIDGDGQMDPNLVSALVSPIKKEELITSKAIDSMACGASVQCHRFDCSVIHSPFWRKPQPATGNYLIN